MPSSGQRSPGRLTSDAVAADPLRTPLCDMLGIELPILLAPMAGGWTTPELVGSVSAAGGFGVVGVMGMTAEAAGGTVRAAGRHAGGRGVGVNIQIAPPRPGSGTRQGLREHMAPLRRELALPEEGPAP